MTIDVKHFEDCEQLFMSVGHCYLIEALLEFFKMDNINELPKENNPFPPDEYSEGQKKAHLLAVLDKFLEQYISLEIPACGKDLDGDCGDDDAVMIAVMGYSTMELTFCHHLCYCWIASMLWHLGMENIWH